jgi:hypothetical protein
MCVAPWLKYDFNIPLHPTVSATFGADCTIHTRVLRPTSADYPTQTLTPQQTRLFNTGEAFTPAVDFLIQHALPFDVISGIQQYRTCRDTANVVHAEIQAKQEQYMKLLEGTMEVLNDLELADAFNRVVAVKDTAQLNASPHFDSMKALNRFLKDLPDRKYYPVVPETRPSAPLARRLAPPARRVPLAPLHCAYRKRCYKCGGMGHIRQDCPSTHTYTTYAQRTGPPKRK